MSTAKARTLRRNSTDAERKLWVLLRSRQLSGWKFRRQVPIGPYIADFICFEARLIIEADGGQHAENPSDTRRDGWFEREGFRILRFWNHDLINNLQGALETISAALITPHPTIAAQWAPPSPAKGEGTADGAKRV